MTHQGNIIYENRYSTDKEEVFGWAVERAKKGVRVFIDHIEELEKELKQKNKKLIQEKNNLESLLAKKASGIL